MTITALPSLVQPTTNKRNTALIQKSMEQSLGVSPQRGLIRFIAAGEENLATNSRTVLGEIEELERESKEEIHSPTFRNGHATSKSNEVKRSVSKKDEKDAKNKGRRASFKNLKHLKTGKGMEKADTQGDELSGNIEKSGSRDVQAPDITNGDGTVMSTGSDFDTDNAFGVKMPGVPTEKSSMDRKAEKAQKLGRRRSFIAAVFGKS